MAEESNSALERLRRRFARLQATPSAKAGQPTEQELNERREKIDALAVRGQFVEALRLEEENFKEMVELFGMNDPRTLHSLDNISSFNFSIGDYENGEKILDQVITLRTGALGENHPDTLASIASKVGVLHGLGQFPQAEELGLDCLKRCEEHLQFDDAATLRAASNLASVYLSKGDLSNAETLCKQVLELRLRTLPDDDIDTVRSKVNLSGVYFGQKRWDDAAVILESVLTIRRRSLGDGHPQTLKIAKQLEHAYRESQRWKDCQTIQVLILEITVKEVGEGSEEALDAMMNLGMTYIELKAWANARSMFEEIMKFKKRHPSSNHPGAQALELSYLESILDNMPVPEQSTREENTLIYGPLDPEKNEIRLVHIEKGTPGQTLCGRLTCIPLRDAPAFEALSYVWGNPENPESLEFEGHHLNITANLQSALLELRLSTRDRLLWVDAICINQQDLKERSEQVQIMREVYSKANKTIVWLGQAEANSSMTMLFLKELELHPSPEEFVFNMLNTHDDTHDELWQSLESIFKKRAYWRRLWIIQEIVCSKDLVVHCGSHSVAYSTMRDVGSIFSRACFRLSDYNSIQKHEKLASKLLLYGVPAGSRNSPTDSEGRPLLELLTLHKNALCTDLRDRIYGLLGISSLHSSTHTGLKIDYTQSVGEVYRGAARAVIEETERLDILCMSCHAVARPDTNEYRPRQPYLPTWAPDWNLFNVSLPLSATYPNATASGDLPAQFNFSPEGGILTVSGVMIASIAYCSERFEITTTAHKDMIRLFLGWRLLTQAHLGIHPSQQTDPRLDQFYRLIFAENSSFEQSMPHKKDWWAEWQTQFLKNKSIDAFEIKAHQKIYLQHLFDFCAGKRLAFCESPRCGNSEGYELSICPNEAEEGDLLCVLLGCKYPVLLRPADGYFELIGGALVPGYMKGEAIEKMRQGSVKVQNFVIH